MAKKDNMSELKNDLSRLKNRVKDIESEFEGNMYSKAQRLKERAMDAEKELERKIEERPIQSVSIAFGTGILAGVLASLLIKRRHKR